MEEDLNCCNRMKLFFNDIKNIKFPRIQSSIFNMVSLATVTTKFLKGASNFLMTFGEIYWC